MAPVAGELLDDRFRVIRTLGRGGAAEVFEVEHLLTGQRRAMKRLHPRHARSGADLARFVREARILGQLDHPGIPAIHDAGRLSDGSTYLLLDLLDGEDLEAHLARRGPLPVEEATRIATGILRALGAAHAAGVIHRDLKPENVFVTNAGEVQLIDFGVATHLAGWTDELGRLTRTDALVGTPAYLAPEVVAGRRPDVRADLYGVGAILFRMLEGRARFEGRGLVDLLGRIGGGQGHPLTRADVPPALAALVARALAVDPDARPASALAFERALRDRSPHPGKRVAPVGCALAVLGVGLFAAAVVAGAMVATRADDRRGERAEGTHASESPRDPAARSSAAPRPTTVVPLTLSGIPSCDRYAIAFCGCMPENCGSGYDPLHSILVSFEEPWSAEEVSELARACSYNLDALVCPAADRARSEDTLLRDYGFELEECRAYLERSCRCQPASCDEGGNPATHWEVLSRARHHTQSPALVEHERREFCRRGLALLTECADTP